jgi:hypothetical protein
VLPTSLGGDAVRVVETTRRHPGRATVVTGTVLLERGVGGAATVALGAVGFLLSLGEYDVVRTCVERRVRLDSRAQFPLLRARRDRCYDGQAAAPATGGEAVASLLRGHPPLPAAPRCSERCRRDVRGADGRILSIWAAAKAVDRADPRIYVFRPLLFLVVLVPFTLNGLAVRECSS